MATHQIKIKDFELVIAANLWGADFWSCDAIKYFSQNSSVVIINIYIERKTIPKPKYLSYSVSKAARKNLTLGKCDSPGESHSLECLHSGKSEVGFLRSELSNRKAFV